MSNQGNIIVQASGLVVDRIMFTTGRWSGAETPEIVQGTLERALDWNTANNEPEPSLRYAWESILHDLAHHDAIDRPITALGNTDTPTVIVDFQHKTVDWRREYDRKIVGSWSFEDYLKLDLWRLPAFRKFYHWSSLFLDVDEHQDGEVEYLDINFSASVYCPQKTTADEDLCST